MFYNYKSQESKCIFSTRNYVIGTKTFQVKSSYHNSYILLDSSYPFRMQNDIQVLTILTLSLDPFCCTDICPLVCAHYNKNENMNNELAALTMQIQDVNINQNKLLVFSYIACNTACDTFYLEFKLILQFALLLHYDTHIIYSLCIYLNLLLQL